MKNIIKCGKCGTEFNGYIYETCPLCGFGKYRITLPGSTDNEFVFLPFNY